MPDLSPQAQAVMGAFSKYPLHGDFIAKTLMHGALPAALRAAALCCKRDTLILLSLADELEGEQ